MPLVCPVFRSAAGGMGARSASAVQHERGGGRGVAGEWRWARRTTRPLELDLDAAADAASFYGLLGLVAEIVASQAASKGRNGKR